MKKIKLPYYKDNLELNIEEKNLKAILISKIHEYDPKYGQEEIILNALKNPIGSQRLRKLAEGKKKVVIVTSDHTRSVPSKITLPILLKEIRNGNPNADITILIATGLHRATTKDEMIKMFGEKIVNNEKIIIHNSLKDEDMVYICKLPSGADFSVNKLAIEADLLITEGFVEPHFFAGFSGGRKSILPGICSKETISENHSASAIANINSKTGVLSGNPIHEDMIFAAKKVKVGFILNVALDADKKVIAAFAGDVDQAHLKGCKFIEKMSGAERVMADIVVTSNGGYPLDQNLYQSPKAMSTAYECAGEDGIIIMVASCCDGIGGTNFEELMLSGTPEEIQAKVSVIPPKKTIPEQWSAQKLSEILLKHKIILVTTYLDHELVRKMNLIPASTPDEALKIAYDLKGKDASVTVIPDGVAVMIH